MNVADNRPPVSGQGQAADLVQMSDSRPMANAIVDPPEAWATGQF